MKITIPELSLVVLIGPSGSGKSTFGRTHFKSTEVISSDFCRGLVSDDENDQSATKEAFEVLHFVASKRLAAGKLTVIDATSVQPESRKVLVELARKYHCLPVAIVFNMPEKLCQERNQARPDRQFGLHVVRNQVGQLRRSLRHLKTEGFNHIFTLTSPEQVTSVEIERQPLWNNRQHEHGPFDIIGDIHGCFEETEQLLIKLGYTINRSTNEEMRFQVSHPEGRKVIFLGDLVDRGPATPQVLRLAMDMTAEGTALCVPGNHDVKLMRHLQGKDVSLKHGIVETLEQLKQESPSFKQRVLTFLEGLISHYLLDDGKLVVAHAGLKQEMQGRGSRAVREFALYGETTGETDEFGLPIRYNWAEDYRGKALVVYGHTPVPEPAWLNATLNIDTGCVFGGKLTALRYPEKELVSVHAQRIYCEPIRPLTPLNHHTGLTVQQHHDDILEIDDVLGKRLIETRLQPKMTIREENAIAALEVMSRFAANPKWLIYLPPTMSPSETSKEEGYLEHPAEAFAFYRKEGIEQVVCEEKHMGSRAVVIVCRNEEAAQRRFGVIKEGIGICYTRTGRRFFDDAQLEAELLQRVQQALEATHFWEKFETDWVCLDCELLPWSVKAQSLVLKQYAAVGAASQAALQQTLTALKQAQQRGIDTSTILPTYQHHQALAQRYINAYRHYCWPVNSINDLKLAPFHILATEENVHNTKDHVWHMQTLAEICQADEQILLATPYLVINLNNAASIEQGIQWWQHLTSQGGEGMVVKPFDFITTGTRGILQPAIKCRGPEYLRIIYGMEYDVPANLNRLRARRLGAKRSLALREFSLSMESLERFVRGEPLRKVHECVFGVLALESEPVDPRL
ncbi:polynucleotide kinase-phosphatase [Tengunoibacter tsumagoiensis]|uniref:Polynucleotide kinase-phosphatase n=1 Tax=Tengunoibacter tsumagoiensis TaxID=2014871 RepID=A0A402A3D3_9CHLR|nr:polynucleotide kinase-phosphatase [Tengunoibacter tsumagoiensis]GCE13501.1 polynucleotide kinase-phosphatase [Tengunoibacter tsumagoiensis]